MCLITNQDIPRIAEEDIKCYKILAHERRHYYTPYRDYTIEFNTLLTDKADENINEYFGYNIIESGYFHTYLDKEVALKTIKELNKKRKTKGKEPLKLDVFEAIVPKDSLYYKGVYSDMCSKNLLITNVKI